MNYDKPFKSFDELAHYLECEHGLNTSGTPEEYVHIADTLKIIPYYDLVNGYKDCFMENDIFRKEVHFDTLCLFHAFDRGLQNALFPFSIIVEDYFKNILAYILARDFGVNVKDYLHPRNYISNRGNLFYRKLHEKIERIYSNTSIDRIDEPTRHYVKVHNHIPPWILLKNITFSNAINLFLLMKPAQKQEIANIMISGTFPVDQKIQILLYALTLIRKCRNRIAHNLKFISFDASMYSKNINKKILHSWIPQDLLSKNDIQHDIGIHDIYGYIVFSLALIPDCLLKLLSISRLTAYFSYYQGIPRLSEMWQNQIKIYSDVTKLPIDIASRLKKYQDTISII